MPPLGAVWLVPDPEPVVEAPEVEAGVVEAPEGEEPAEGKDSQKAPAGQADEPTADPTVDRFRRFEQ